jgi:aminomethyltransferase
VALGFPRYGQDIRERDLPQETEQTRALNFSKGCYVGQEIVERIRSRGAVHRTFTGFVFEGNQPAVGSKVQVDGKEVGEITSSASLPVNGGMQNLGLGYIRREAGSAGKEIVAGDIRATVAELPFKVVFG